MSLLESSWDSCAFLIQKETCSKEPYLIAMCLGGVFAAVFFSVKSCDLIGRGCSKNLLEFANSQINLAKFIWKIGSDKFLR